MNSNAKTLATYNDHFSSYISGTAQVTSGFQKEWLESLLNHCQMDARILEIGAAFGRDATFIAERGFTNLLVTDAFDAAVETLRGKGLPTKKLNVLEDELRDSYDLILASAVFLHFTTEEFVTVLTKLKTALSPSGLLGFSVKNGSGEEWSDAKMGAPRFFRYWTEPELRQVLVTTGYQIVDFRHSEDEKWLHVACAVERK